MRSGIGTKVRYTIGLAAIAGALALPGAASAGLLTGILSTEAASDCDPAVQQYFAPWGDTAWYRPVPGGTFEGTHGWSLANGAKVVNGNEPWYVKGKNNSRSLYMPAGSTATSPTTCFDFGDWHARFFVRNAGGSSGTLEVDILVRSLVGVLSVLDGGYVRADGSWDPSPEVSALVTNVGGLLGTSAVSFRLKARSTAFQVDDVFLDPFRSR